MTTNERQVGGEHYRSAYQSWDFILDVFGGDFFLGNVNKYVTRYRRKNGLEDLRKARHYLLKYVETLADGRINPPRVQSVEALAVLVSHYIQSNKLSTAEEDILIALAAHDYAEAVRLLEELMDEEVERGSIHPGND